MKNQNLTPRPRTKTSIDFDPAGNMTEQSHREELNINNILAKFQRTGVVDHVKEHGPQYADVPAIDYREAMEIVTSSNSMFNELPARARAYFDNDPAKFLESVQNPDTDLNKLHEIGLLRPDYSPENATEELTEASQDTETAQSEENDA